MVSVTIVCSKKDFPFARTLRKRLREFVFPPQAAKSARLERRPCKNVILQLTDSTLNSPSNDVLIVIGSAAFHDDPKSKTTLTALLKGAKIIIPVISPLRKELSFKPMSAFPEEFCNYINEKDLLWLDMHAQAEGLHDGLHKLIARCLELPIGAVRDRVIERELQITRRRFAGTIALGLGTLSAVALYFVAVVAGQSMNESFEAAGMVLLATQRDLGSFSKLPNAASEQATIQLADNIKAFDDFATVARSNGTYGATFDEMRIYARLYLFQAQTQRGDYDAGFATFRDSLSISKKINIPQTGDVDQFNAEELPFVLRGVAIGEYARTENMEIVRGLMKDNFTEAAEYARRRPNDVFSAMRFAEMAYNYFQADPAPYSNRTDFEQRFEPVWHAIDAIPNAPLSRGYVPSSMSEEIVGDIYTVKEFKLVISAAIQIASLEAAKNNDNHAWFDSQKENAEAAVEALEKEVGRRAEPARHSIDDIIYLFSTSMNSDGAMLTFKQETLSTMRSSAQANADDIGAQLTLFNSLMDIGLLKVQQHDHSFKNEMTEAIQKIDNIRVLDPNNLRLQAASAIGRGFLAGALAESGDCSNAAALQAQALSQLNKPADQQKSALKWRRLQEELKTPLVCKSGVWTQ